MPKATRSVSRRTALSQSSINENSSTSRTRNNVSLSQSRIEDYGDLNKSVEEMVNDCVRYLILNAGKKTIFRKADLQKSFDGKTAGFNLQKIIEKTTDILKNIYGYNLILYDGEKSTSKCYVLSNALPYMNYKKNPEQLSEEDCAKGNNKIILLLILSHIFMSHNSITEASLHSFLDNLGIDVNVRHPTYGLISSYIKILIAQKFLTSVCDPISKKVTYQWGVRAETEISKHSILKFVSKIYNNRQPSSWTNQFRDANEQGFDNQRQVELMEVVEGD